MMRIDVYLATNLAILVLLGIVMWLFEEPSTAGRSDSRSSVGILKNTRQ